MRLNKWIILLLAAWLQMGCATKKQESSELPLVVTTTGMIADAAAQVCGSDAQVESLMGPGVDPHLYKATQGDLQLLRDADIIIYNGLHLEGKMQEIFDELAKTKTVIRISDGIATNKLLQASNNAQQAYDPHIWFDVALWAEGIAGMTNALAMALPDASANIRERGEQYVEALSVLHEEVIQLTSALPPDSKTIITSHDAFGYFGAAYGFRVLGLQGISTAAEFGLKDVTDMVDLIITDQVPAVFIESSVSEKSIQSVIKGCEAKGHALRLGGMLYSDAMGAKNTAEGTYIGMVQHNVQTIIKALEQ
jgi:manganese/zinc/iron transport system substrate-binding protein